MKKLLLLSYICLSCTITQGYAQNKAQNTLYQIHKLVKQQFEEDGTQYNVAKATQKKAIENFDFKNPDGIDTAATNIWKTPRWKSFLDRIAIESVSEYQLAGGARAWFKTKPKRPVMVFAPVIISPDTAMALSIVMLFTETGKPSSNHVYFLEKVSHKWQVKQRRLITIFD